MEVIMLNLSVFSHNHHLSGVNLLAKYIRRGIRVLAAVGGTPAIAWGLALLVALHLIWAGIGMVLLAEKLGLSKLAQTVSALAFSLCGYLVARAGFHSINSAVAWLPWLLLTALYVAKNLPRQKHIVDAERRASGSVFFIFKNIFSKPVLCLAVCMALQLLAGHAQVTWYSLLLAGLWIGFWGWHNRGVKGWLIAWFNYLTAMLIGVSMAAVQLLPTAEYLLQSQRASAVDYSLAMTYSFWPWRLLGLLAPGFFGSPVWGDYWGYANYWEDAIYIGILPVFLALGALFKKNKLGHLRWFLMILLPLTILLALGKNTPIFPWLYHHIPGFNLFQAPARWMIWVEFALALLAGFGVEEWRRPQGRSLYWTRLGTAAAFAVTVGAVMTGLYAQIGLDLGRLVTMVRATALAGFWALGVGVLSLIAPISGKDDAKKGVSNLTDETMNIKAKECWGYMVTLWVSLDLLVAGWGLNPAIPLDFYNTSSSSLPWRENISQVKSELNGGRLFLPAQDEIVLMYKRFFRFTTFDPPTNLQSSNGWYDLRSTLLPNLNLGDNIASVNNYDPIISDRYARWMTAINHENLENREYILDFMGVSMEERIETNSSSGVRFDQRLYSSRFHWSACAKVAKTPEEALKLTLERVGRASPLVLEDIPSKNLSLMNEGIKNSELCSGVAKIQKINENPNHLILSTKTDSDGWLWVADVWFPGWKAWVDDKPIAVTRANYLFRAVFVPRGNHEVIFAYQPEIFYWGAGLSILTWLGLTIWLISRNIARPVEIPCEKKLE